MAGQPQCQPPHQAFNGLVSQSAPRILNDAHWPIRHDRGESDHSHFAGHIKTTESRPKNHLEKEKI